LIVTVVTMTAMLGITALAIDASFMYDKRNRLHAAADAAAKSAATEVARDSTLSPNLNRTCALNDTDPLCRFASQQITAHGFNPGGATSVVVNHPPLSGWFTCANQPVYCNRYVEVIVSEATATFFANV